MPVFVWHYLQAHCAFTDTVRRTTFKAMLARPIHDAVTLEDWCFENSFNSLALLLCARLSFTVW